MQNTSWSRETPLVLPKEIRMPPNRAKKVMLQPKYTTTLYHPMLNLQGTTIIFVDPFDKYSPFYLIMTQFEANRCVINIKK